MLGVSTRPLDGGPCTLGATMLRTVFEQNDEWGE
jgi:hypothetical protein